MVFSETFKLHLLVSCINPKSKCIHVDDMLQCTRPNTGPRSLIGRESGCRSRDREFMTRSHSFAEIDHELFSLFILLLPLIQERLVSATSESMCTKHWLTIFVNLAQDKKCG